MTGQLSHPRVRDTEPDVACTMGSVDCNSYRYKQLTLLSTSYLHFELSSLQSHHSSASLLFEKNKSPWQRGRHTFSALSITHYSFFPLSLSHLLTSSLSSPEKVLSILYCPISHVMLDTHTTLLQTYSHCHLEVHTDVSTV